MPDSKAKELFDHIDAILTDNGTCSHDPTHPYLDQLRDFFHAPINSIEYQKVGITPVHDIDKLRQSVHAVDKALMAVECFDHQNLERLAAQRKRIEIGDYHEAVIERVEQEIRDEYVENHGNARSCFLCLERDTKSWKEFAKLVDYIRNDEYGWHDRASFCKPCQALTHANDLSVGKIEDAD